MSTAILPAEQAPIATKYATEENFGQLATAKKWIPNLMYFTSNSEPCKAGTFPVNHYGIKKSKTQIVDVGKNFVGLIYGWRPKAVDLNGDKPMSFYNPADESFQRVKLEADKPGLNGFMCGPEFLIWIAGQGFVTFLMASTSAKNEAEAVHALIGKAALFDGKLIENKSYKWFCPFAIESTQVPDLPPQDEYQRIQEQFSNPPESEVELAPEGDKANEGQPAREV